MLVLKHVVPLSKALRRLNHVYCNHIRTISNSEDEDLFMYREFEEPKLNVYTPEEQRQIIDTIKKCVQTDSPRIYLTKTKLKNLKPILEKHPNLNSLEPLISAKGLGPKSLNLICDNILNKTRDKELVDDTRINGPGYETDFEKLRVPSLLTPSNISQSVVDSVMSIKLAFNAVSWARLTPATGVLDCWDVRDMHEFVDKKFDVHSVWNMVMALRDVIPDADIYVMENTNWSNVSNIKMSMKFFIQQAMLTTAICSIFNQIDCNRQPWAEEGNRLYFLRAFTPARVFHKLVGSERVSMEDVVLDMMSGVEDPRHQPIQFTNDSVDTFHANNGHLRDNMCQSLLLAVTFTEMVLLKNSVALKTIRKGAKSKKKVSSE